MPRLDEGCSRECGDNLGENAAVGKAAGTDGVSGQAR